MGNAVVDSSILDCIHLVTLEVRHAAVCVFALRLRLIEVGIGRS